MCVRACVCLSDSHTFLIVTLVNTIETKPLHISLSNFVAYFFVKLARHVNRDERMHPIDFGGQRSKVKVTMDIY